jgi:hypothetical protein
MLCERWQNQMIVGLYQMRIATILSAGNQSSTNRITRVSNSGTASNSGTVLSCSILLSMGHFAELAVGRNKSESLTLLSIAGSVVEFNELSTALYKTKCRKSMRFCSLRIENDWSRVCGNESVKLSLTRPRRFFDLPFFAAKRTSQLMNLQDLKLGF